MENKTGQDKTDETRHTTSKQPQRSPPWMQQRIRKSNIWKTRQDRATAEIPASDAANASEEPDSGRQGKTRQDKTDKTRHATSRATAEIPASDASKASEEHDYGRQDKTAGARL